MQYLCGLTELTDKPIFDPSLFVTIRKRITDKEINEMTQRLLEEAKKRKATAEEKKDKDGHDETPGNEAASHGKEDEFAKEYVDTKGRLHKGRLHKGVLKMDATCAEAEVRYPVDVDIIHDGYKVVDRYIGKLCKALHISKPHTYYKDARRVYLELVKLKKKGGRLVRQTKSAMLNFLAKDLRSIVGLFVDYKGSKDLSGSL